jgi:hypothetical protein
VFQCIFHLSKVASSLLFAISVFLRVVRQVGYPQQVRFDAEATIYMGWTFRHPFLIPYPLYTTLNFSNTRSL